MLEKIELILAVFYIQLSYAITIPFSQYFKILLHFSPNFYPNTLNSFSISLPFFQKSTPGPLLSRIDPE